MRVSRAYRSARYESPALREGPRGLLREGRGTGYPVEYLLSRVRGRRSRLVRDWRTLVYDAAPLDHLASARYEGFVQERSAEGMWRALLREHAWVYVQMDDDVRTLFAPYLLYAELRTICICLRYLRGEKTQKAGEVLDASLLADRVKAVLRDGAAGAAVAGLERLLCGLSPEFTGLGGLYEDKGLREVEQQLTGRYLRYILSSSLHPAVRELFTRIVDARNILSLFKSLRSSGKDRSPFLPGGTVPVERLMAVLEQDDIFGVSALIRLAAGVKIAAPGPTQVEAALYRGITKFLKNEGRDPLGAALILDHLWRCSLEVMNLSVLFAGKDLEREEVAAELVY